jgi:hypothetical protein
VLRSITFLSGLMALSFPLAAQSKTVNLTGRPVATLDEPFTAISGLVEMPGNKAVVLDVQESRLLMVSFANGAITPIGRRGGGPGEWRQPLSLLRGTANQAILGDPGLSKLHLVGPDGKISGAILPPGDDPREMIGMTMSRGTDSRGRLYFQAMPAFTGGGIPDSANIVRFDPASKQSEVLGTIPTGMTGSVSGSAGSMEVRMRAKPLAATDAWTALPDGRVAIVRANPYRVDIVSGKGQVQRGPAVNYTPVRIGKAERDLFREQRASQRPVMISIGGGGGSTSDSRQLGGPAGASGIPDEEFPAVMPPFTGRDAVQVTPEGEIWVLRTRGAADKTPTYDIFSSSGQLVGKATLKPNSTVVGFGAGVVYVARQDPEDDLRYLEKYVR